jgi:DNA-binding transcriptional LysR family regulator
MAHSSRYKDLQLGQLRSFCLVAQLGNFSAAAKELELSTPTVWQQVRALEASVGAKLLRQRGRSLELTDDGRLLLELVQPHLSGMDSLARLFEDRRAEMPQRVVVASTPYLLAYHLPQAVRAMIAAHPAVRLNLRVCIELAETLHRVDRGDADLAVTAYDSAEPRQPRLDYEHLFDAPFVLLTALDHPLARKKRLTPADLVRYPLILAPEGSHDRRTLDGILHRHDLADQVQPVMETRSLDILTRYVALGVGIALAHISLDIDLSGAKVHLRRLDPDMEAMPVALVTRKGGHRTPAVEKFCQVVRRCLATGK